ncbi:NUDIX domain-containing protein [Nonomuraea sp. SYSU D8015]
MVHAGRGVRDGETPAVAAARELREEIGYRVRPTRTCRGTVAAPGIA